MVNRKIICIILCYMLMLMLTGAFVSVSANETATLSEKAIFDLKSFGILQGDENGDYKLDKNMTRAEFVATIIRLLRCENISDASQSRFSDVSSDMWYSKYINTAANLKIINGSVDGRFHPNDNIQFNEAVKILVASLGYTYLAEENSGYPNGYLSVATKMGLLNGVTISEYSERADLFLMEYNALDIDMMVTVPTKNGNSYTYKYQIENGNTLRKMYDNDVLSDYLQLGRGIVDANGYYYINNPVSNIKLNQIQINGVLYQVGDTKASEYIGQEIDFYTTTIEDNGTNRTIASIKPTNNNTVYILTEKEFLRVEEDNVIYNDTNLDKEKEIKLSDNVRFIFNGVPQTSFSNRDICVNSGELKLIDNNGDRKVDVVFREEFSHLRVNRTMSNRIVFEDGQKHMGLGQFVFDVIDDEKKYIIKNADGVDIEFKDIKPDSIVSIMSNQYLNLNKIIVSERITEGIISELYVDDGFTHIKINGEEYTVVKSFVFDYKVGDDVKAYINYKGDIADFEMNDSNDKYGYVVQATIKRLGNPMVKVLIPGTMSVEYDIDDSDPDNIKKTPYLKGHNSDVIIFELASKVTVNGISLDNELRKYPAATLTLQYDAYFKAHPIIKYNLNKEGEISKIDFPELLGSRGERVYNGYERTFGASNIGAFGTDDKTKVLCVPNNVVSTDDDYFAKVDITNAQTYKINGYDIIDTDQIAKLSVITMSMKSDSIPDINALSKISVVSEIKDILDENGEVVTKMSFFSDGVQKNYPIGDTVNTLVSTLKFGDVFYYTLNPLGEIANIKIVSKNNTIMYKVGSVNTEMTMLGRINDVDYKTLIDIYNKYVDRTTIFFDGTGIDTFELETDTRNAPIIYIVKRNSKKVTVGSREDLAPSIYPTDYIFAHILGAKIKGIVLYSN